jgi:hypothetical protein
MIPSRVCPVCDEFLPHYCAAIVIVRRLPFGRKEVVINDR